MGRPPHLGWDVSLLEGLLDRTLHIEDLSLSLLAALLDLLGERRVGVRLEGLEREVFELPPDRGHPQPVRERRVDLTGLASDAPPLMFGQVLERAHVVHSVGELHEDDTSVFSHGEQHFSIVLDLLLRGGPEPDLSELRDTVDDRRYFAAEALLQVGEREFRVLDDIVD